MAKSRRPEEALMTRPDETTRVKFRDPATASRMADTIQGLLDEIGRDSLTIMHVCGSHSKATSKNS